MLLLPECIDPGLFYFVGAAAAFLFLALIRCGYLKHIVQRSRDHYKNLLDASPFGVALTTSAGTIHVANKSLADFLGTEVTELKGRDLSELLGIDYWRYYSSVEALRPGNFVVLPIVESKQPDGAIQYLTVRIFASGSEENLFFWHVVDETEKIRLELEHMELLENVPVGIFRSNMEGDLTYKNHKFQQFFENTSVPATLNALLGENLWTLIRKEIIKKGATFSTGLIIESEGNPKHFMFSVKCCEYDGGLCLAGTLEDVTSLAELNRRLKSAVDKAKEASKAKSAFLAKMSHELRTPLNVIHGVAELLRNRVTDDGALDLINDLQYSSEHLTALIGDILDLAKIESGGLEINKEPLDFQELINSLEKVLGVQARLKGLSFSVKIRDGVPRYFIGDPVRIKQIIYNLVGNSLKFVEEGGILIGIEGRGQKEDGKVEIEMAVSDTGPGIPSDVLPNIFKPFVQDKQGKIKGGTGLGLAITKELAEMMGGSISVESTVGLGTVFRVRLVVEPCQEDMVDKVSKVGHALDDVRPGRALIVDDVAMNRKVLRLLLETRKWGVVEAENGQQALDILEQDQAFDVVLMDVSMPVMDGVTATKRIKENKKTGHLPVIGITAHALADDKRRFLEAGMNSYISKPVNSDKLWEQLSVLSGMENHAEGEEPAAEKPEPDMDDSSEPVDMVALLDTCQGMNELAKELVEDLVKESGGWLDAAARAVDAKNLKEIRRVCHLVKGTASTVHAGELFLAAEELGRAARNGDMEMIGPGFSSLQDAVQRLKNWYEEGINNSEPSCAPGLPSQTSFGNRARSGP